jgi:hypothetical protein
MENNIKLAKERFELLFPDNRLLAIQLNGFSHTAFYDDGTADNDPEVLRFSAYAPEQKWDKRAIAMFSGIPHYEYQGNAIEHVFLMPGER